MEKRDVEGALILQPEGTDSGVVITNLTHQNEPAGKWTHTSDPLFWQVSLWLNSSGNHRRNAIQGKTMAFSDLLMSIGLHEKHIIISSFISSQITGRRTRVSVILFSCAYSIEQTCWLWLLHFILSGWNFPFSAWLSLFTCREKSKVKPMWEGTLSLLTACWKREREKSEWLWQECH